MFALQAASQRRVMFGWPAFRRTVFGARRKNEVASALQAQWSEHGLDFIAGNAQTRRAKGRRIARQRQIEVDHRRTPAPVGEAPVEQAVAALAEIADAARNARQERQQRRLQRIRQHVGGIEAAAQLAGSSPARLPVEAAVGKWQFDDLADTVHRPVDRRHPGQRGDRQPLAACSQRPEKRLAHDRVADPLRRNHERAHHARGPRARRRCALLSADAPSRRPSACRRCRSTGTWHHRW